MQKVLSVSVAAYNLETMIRKCLDSFIAPDVIDRVEVLVTDDGSKDSTPDIVREYESRYPGSIILIQQKNAGPGSTVNSGIEHATGKYFRMVDGDDWVNTEAMGGFLDFLESTDADMVCSHYCCVKDMTFEQEFKIIKGVSFGRTEYFNNICQDLSLSMHNITYKTELLKNGPIRLDNGFYTDREYMLLPLMKVDTVAFFDQTIYMYRIGRDGQSMNMKSMQRNIKMHELVIRRLLDEYEGAKYSLTTKKETDNFICKDIAAMIGMQLLIYLSFDDSKKYRTVTKAFMNEIKSRNPRIYKIVSQTRTMKILNVTNYLAFDLISKYQRKKH